MFTKKFQGDGRIGVNEENSHLLTNCKENHHCTYDLLVDWFGFNETNKSVVNFNVSKASESKPIMQDLSCTLILSLMN